MANLLDIISAIGSGGQSIPTVGNNGSDTISGLQNLLSAYSADPAGVPPTTIPSAPMDTTSMLGTQTQPFSSELSPSMSTDASLLGATPTTNPAEDKKSSKSNKKLIDILGTIGGFASAVSPILFGKEAGIDLGGLVSPIVGHLQTKELRKGMESMFKGHPELARIFGAGQDAANSGGILNGLNRDELIKLADSSASSILKSQTTPMEQAQAQANLDKTLADTFNLQHPEIKNAAALQQQKDLADYKNELLLGRKDEIRAQTPLPQFAMDKIIKLEDEKAMYDSISSGYNSPAVQSEIGGLSLSNDFKKYAGLEEGAQKQALRGVITRQFPNSFAVFQQLQDAVDKRLRDRSGMQINMNEMNQLKIQSPSIMDSPQAVNNRIKDIQVMDNLKKWNLISKYPNNDVEGASGGTINPQEIKAYNEFVRIKNSPNKTDKEKAFMNVFKTKHDLKFSFEQ